MADKKYQVFISSTYADLKEERRKILDILLMADCIPSGMEAFVATDNEQFEVIKKVIDLCDYYVLIIGKRYGSVSPLTGKSYTEMEYDYAKSKDIPVLVFAIDDSIELPECKIESDPMQIELLGRFREKAMSNRLASIWKTTDELTGKLAVSIMRAKDEILRPGWIRANNSFEHRLDQKRANASTGKNKNPIDNSNKTQNATNSTKKEESNQYDLNNQMNNSLEDHNNYKTDELFKENLKTIVEVEKLKHTLIEIECFEKYDNSANITIKTIYSNLFDLFKIIVQEMRYSTLPIERIVRIIKKNVLQQKSDVTVHFSNDHFIEKLLEQLMYDGYLEMPYKNYWRLSMKGDNLVKTSKEFNNV